VEPVGLILSSCHVDNANFEGSLQAANGGAALIWTRGVREGLGDGILVVVLTIVVHARNPKIRERKGIVLTSLGGPALPLAASWMCVAVSAGDAYSPVTPLRVML
jgi:hypothetical protein